MMIVCLGMKDSVNVKSLGFSALEPEPRRRTNRFNPDPPNGFLNSHLTCRCLKPGGNLLQVLLQALVTHGNQPSG